MKEHQALGEMSVSKCLSRLRPEDIGLKENLFPMSCVFLNGVRQCRDTCVRRRFMVADMEVKSCNNLSYIYTVRGSRMRKLPRGTVRGFRDSE